VNEIDGRPVTGVFCVGQHVTPAAARRVLGHRSNTGDLGGEKLLYGGAVVLLAFGAWVAWKAFS
jgi:hypothetical protein